MKKILLGCVGLLVLGAATSMASAADLPRAYPPAMAPTYAPLPIYNWTGLYVGINGGGGWGDSRWDNAFAPVGSFDVSGGLIGGTIGYNWQFNQVVFGLEGDIDWTNIKGTGAGCCETSNSWLGTVRGRLGYAYDRFMPYVTGGVAFGDIKASIPGFAGGSSTNAGWTLGAGLEFAVVGNLTAKVEYLHVDLGDFDCGTACGAPIGPDNVNFKANIVRGGLNYRF
jgi:outer membrane immunogenic protein